MWADKGSRFVARDIDITDLSFVPRRVARSLERINVRTARQMFHRLHDDGAKLWEYLRVDPTTEDKIRSELREVIEREFPEDLLRFITPKVSKSGVAVRRLTKKPKYYDEADVYVPPHRR
jgi:hypothetical protein